jgi:hypothetical protein
MESLFDNENMFNGRAKIVLPAFWGLKRVLWFGH